MKVPVSELEIEEVGRVWGLRCSQAPYVLHRETFTTLSTSQEVDRKMGFIS